MIAYIVYYTLPVTRRHISMELSDGYRYDDYLSGELCW